LILGIHHCYTARLRSFVAVSWKPFDPSAWPNAAEIRAPLSKDENELLERYKGILFHRNHYEAVPGLAIFIPFMMYLFLFWRDFVRYVVGKNPT